MDITTLPQSESLLPVQIWRGADFKQAFGIRIWEHFCEGKYSSICNSQFTKPLFLMSNSGSVPAFDFEWDPHGRKHDTSVL